MLSMPDFITPPLVSAAIAALVGIKAAGLRARGRARWLLAVDVLFLTAALVPATLVAGIVKIALGDYPGDTSWIGLLVGMAVVAAPLAYLPVRIVLCRVNDEYRDTIRLLGLGTIQRSLQLELPLGWRAMLLGTLLAFTRVFGELAAAIGPVDHVGPFTILLFVPALVSALFLVRWLVPHAAR
jgi:ABC-type spermidine/putrescine transport system permease subunit II